MGVKTKKTGCIILLSACMLLYGINVFAGSGGKGIAVVKSRQTQLYAQFLSGLKDGLAAAGSVAVDEYDMEDSATLFRIKNGDYDLICSVGTGATRWCKKEIINKPIVFSMVFNPVSSGIVDSMASPGPNITGVSLNVSIEKQFRLLRKIIPSAKKVRVFYGSVNAGMVSKAKAKAANFDLEVKAVEVDSAIRLPIAVRNATGRVDVLWLIPDNIVYTEDSLAFIINDSINSRLPAMVFAPYLAKAGGIFSYAIDYESIGGQTAQVIARVLGGEPAGSIPVAVPRKVNYVINAKSADYFGIKLTPEVVKKAIEVYR